MLNNNFRKIYEKKGKISINGEKGEKYVFN
jgi:hypothetical protein